MQCRLWNRIDLKAFNAIWGSCFSIGEQCGIFKSQDLDLGLKNFWGVI